jgi:hypothetical protein
MATAAGLAQIRSVCGWRRAAKELRDPDTGGRSLFRQRHDLRARRARRRLGRTSVYVPRRKPVLASQLADWRGPQCPGDLQEEIRMFLAAGIDGFFTDNTDAVSKRATRSRGTSETEPVRVRDEPARRPLARTSHPHISAGRNALHSV